MWVTVDPLGLKGLRTHIFPGRLKKQKNRTSYPR